MVFLFYKGFGFFFKDVYNQASGIKKDFKMVAFKKITSIPLLNVTVFVKTLSKCRCLVKNDIFRLFFILNYKNIIILTCCHTFLVFYCNCVCSLVVRMSKLV